MAMLNVNPMLSVKPMLNVLTLLPTPLAAPPQAEAEPPTASLPDSAGLVDGSVALAERAPATAFWLTDLLKTHSALSTPNRQVGAGWPGAQVVGGGR